MNRTEQVKEILKKECRNILERWTDGCDGLCATCCKYDAGMNEPNAPVDDEDLEEGEED